MRDLRWQLVRRCSRLKSEGDVHKLLYNAVYRNIFQHIASLFGRVAGIVKSPNFWKWAEFGTRLELCNPTLLLISVSSKTFLERPYVDQAVPEIELKRAEIYRFTWVCLKIRTLCIRTPLN